MFESFQSVRAVGLDVTLKTTRPAEDIWKVFRPAGATVSRAIEIFIRKQKKERICLHDPLAAAAVVDDRVLQFEPGTVQIETEGKAAEGVTVFRPKPDGPHRVAKEVDLERFRADYEQVLRKCRAVRQG